MDFDEWLAYGIANGFCSEQVCETHGWIPSTETEDVLFEQGHDPCRHVVRLGNEAYWESDAQAYLEIAND